METNLTLQRNRIMAWWLGIPHAWRLAFILWLGMRLLLWGLGAFIYLSGWFPIQSGYSYGIDTLSGPVSGSLFGVWMRWDAVYYNLILSQGYHALPQLSAYFPLFPLLAIPFTWLGIHPNIALILVSNLAFLAALGVFLGEVENLFGSGLMLPAGLILLTFPGAFFFYTPFPQSLALLLILLSWRYAQRHQWLAAAVLGLLGGLTHSTAAPLSVLLLFEAIRWMRSDRGKLNWAALGVPTTPVLGTLLFFAWRQSQGFPQYIALQSQNWKMSLFDPTKGLAQLITSLGDAYWLSYVKLFILLLSIFSIFWLFRNRFFALGSYQLVLTLFIASFTMPNSPLGSFIRYGLLGFPLIMALGAWSNRRKWVLLSFLVGFTMINLILTGLFLSWVFVA